MAWLAEAVADAAAREITGDLGVVRRAVGVLLGGGILADGQELVEHAGWTVQGGLSRALCAQCAQQ